MANIDDELLFLRDAKDGDGLIAREAIAYALYTIYNDRMYPPTTLDVTENGTYIAESIEKPFGTINVNVEGTTKFYDGVADIFTITENGTYYSQDMFNGKNLIIQEFEVDVPTLTVDLQPLTVNANGTYIAENGQAFAPVTVNIPNAKKPGDYVTASMYFYDPNNPNDASYIFIDKDDHILFGESARHFLERFPRFRNINGYSHIDWNPKPDSVTADQWFIPTWENTPVDYVEEERYIDYDIFLYIVRHKILEYFFDLEQTIRVMIDDTEQELHCYGKGITDADGHQTNYCFYMDSTDELASSYQYVLNNDKTNWSFKRWNGLNKIEGKDIWICDDVIYYSNGEQQYYLDKQTSTWYEKTWTGLNNFSGRYIWTDGNDIYYSLYDIHYVLNKETSTWEPKTWIGLTDFYAYNIWTDGTNIYCSEGTNQYVLNKETSTWETKSWSGLTNFNGEYIWTDGTDIYYSYYTSNFVLNQNTLEWETKNWNKPDRIHLYGNYIWTDGINVYYTYDTEQFIIDTQNSRLIEKTWTGLNRIHYGDDIWHDGSNVYYSTTSYNYKKPMYCSNDISDITSESPIDGDSYYGYKCSLIRALINRDRSGLVRQSDMDIYDNSNWSIYHFIPQTLLNDIIPISYYTTRPKQVSNSNPFKTKDVPRKNIELVQGPDTYREVVERTGNPREQGWYEYNSTNKTFILTTDTTVRAGKMYYIKGSSYDISVDEPFVSDEYEKMSVGTAWSAYDKNIRHSPILFINQSSGRYIAYKKVNGEFVEYTSNDHIKYINTHTGSGTGYYLYWWCIWGVREKIMYVENLQQRFDFLMENLYRINHDMCVYLYNKESKIYYTFDPTKTDETDAYDSCVRHDMQTDPSFISAVDAGIANNTYTRAFESHSYNQSGGNGKGHIYNSEYDIWPDESYNVYASGNYFEKSTGTHIDPDTGDIYTISFYYYKDGCNDIENHYFYNYYDLMNGRSDCAPAYHYVRRNNIYMLERVSTDYDDYNEETVTYNIEYVTEKVSDKIMAKPINNSIKYNVFVPPYYGYEGTGPDYYPIKRYNIINTPLIEYVSIIKKLENEGYNDKNIIISESDLRGADPYCSFISSNRNNNRNIFADEATINAFDVRRANNASSPNIYPLYSYEEASAIWQTNYDIFTPNYHLRGPHNSYQYVDGTPEKYDVLYFYL